MIFPLLSGVQILQDNSHTNYKGTLVESKQQSNIVLITIFFVCLNFRSVNTNISLKQENNVPS